MKEYIKPNIFDEIIEIEDIVADSPGVNENDSGTINDDEDGFFIGG